MKKACGDLGGGDDFSMPLHGIRLFLFSMLSRLCCVQTLNGEQLITECEMHLISREKSFLADIVSPCLHDFAVPKRRDSGSRICRVGR